MLQQFHSEPFSSDRSKTILSNIKQTRTCSSKGDQTQTSYYWLQTIKHRTSNLIGLKTRFTKLLIKLTGTSFFRTSNEFEHVHLLVITLKHPIFDFE